MNTTTMPTDLLELAEQSSSEQKDERIEQSGVAAVFVRGVVQTQIDCFN